MSEWTTGPVSLGGDGEWLAIYDAGERWNGWLAAPRFDALTTVEILDWLSGQALPGEGEVWEFADDGALVVWDRAYEGERDWRPDVYWPDENGLYALGARAWVWSESDD